MAILKDIINSDIGKEYFNRIGLNRGIPTFIADRLPSFESVKKRLIDPIFQKPSYAMGGMISSDDFNKKFGMTPFYDMKGYRNGGIVTGGQPITVIPSMSRNNINAQVINDSQQSLIKLNSI